MHTKVKFFLFFAGFGNMDYAHFLILKEVALVKKKATKNKKTDE